MTYLFLGPDNEQKTFQISEIKKNLLIEKDSQSLDYSVLYGNKLSSKVLKETLLELPTISKKKVILLHDFHKLSPHNKGLIIEFLSSDQDHAVLILDSNHVKATDSFVKKAKPFVKLVNLVKEQSFNIFDVTRAMTQRKYADALKLLSRLMQEGQHPLQIMGGLVWFWGKTKSRVSKDKYEKGLLFLQEADLDIKRSRLEPDFAMERLIVRLCALMG